MWQQLGLIACPFCEAVNGVFDHALVLHRYPLTYKAMFGDFFSGTRSIHCVSLLTPLDRPQFLSSKSNRGGGRYPSSGSGILTRFSFNRRPGNGAL